MLFTLEFVQDIFSNFVGKLDKATTVEKIMTDSRDKESNALFIPIIGEKFDGHDFLQSAIENGAAAALWDEKRNIPTDVPSSFVFFLVEDTALGLQLLAKNYRDSINPIVIGVTGSNGKTTTKDLLHAVLKNSFKTHATKGNFNNDIGMPLTILNMESNTEVLILEMGMNHFHEIDRLTKIAQPNYAIITNIGESHIEYLGSRQGIAKAKLEIKNGLQKDGTLLIDGDEPLLIEMDHHAEVITCGFNKDNSFLLSDVSLAEDKTSFQLNHVFFHIPLLGKHHAKNASFVIAVARKLGMGDKKIQLGLNQLAYSRMRFERLQGRNDAILINDAYNASATSMKAAIDVIKRLTDFKKKILVLGDILELGDFTAELHRSIATSIDENIDIVFTIGNHANIITDEIKRRNLPITCKHFETQDHLLNDLQPCLSKGTIILFKASRGMKLEQLVDSCM